MAPSRPSMARHSVSHSGTSSASGSLNSSKQSLTMKFRRIPSSGSISSMSLSGSVTPSSTSSSGSIIRPYGSAVYFSMPILRKQLQVAPRPAPSDLGTPHNPIVLDTDTSPPRKASTKQSKQAMLVKASRQSRRQVSSRGNGPVWTEAQKRYIYPKKRWLAKWRTENFVEMYNDMHLNSK